MFSAYNLYPQSMITVASAVFSIKKNSSKLIILFLISGVAVVPYNKLYAQSINHIWLSEESNSCLEFDSVSQTVDIGNFNKYKEGKQRIKYKVRGNKLKIMWHENQTIFGYEKWVYWLTIDLLTDEKLSLTFLPVKRNRIIEMFGGSTVVFKKSDIKCSDYYQAKSAK